MKKNQWMFVGTIPPPLTGQAVAFRMLIDSLNERGWNILHINLSRQRDFNYSKISFARVIEICTIIINYLSGLINGYRCIYLTIAQSTIGFMRDFVMIWLCWLFRGKIIVHFHGGNYDGFYYSQNSIVKFLIKKTLLRTHKIIILGECLRGMFDFETSLSSKIIVIPNGCSSMPYEGVQKTIPSKNNPIKIIFLSNMIKSKGYLVLLKALSYLKNDYNIPFEATFAGQFMSSIDDDPQIIPDKLSDHFDLHVKKYNLGANVSYVGVIRGEKKWEILNESHFFVLPTSYQNEGQPISIIEAMACGCVVISTKFRAIPDLVIDTKTGLLIKHNSPKTIASEIAFLFDNRQNYSSMSLASLQRYNMNFTLEHHLNRIIPVLQGLDVTPG